MGGGDSWAEAKGTDCSCNLLWASAGRRQGVSEILRGPAGPAEDDSYIYPNSENRKRNMRRTGRLRVCEASKGRPQGRGAERRDLRLQEGTWELRTQSLSLNPKQRAWEEQVREDSWDELWGHPAGRQGLGGREGQAGRERRGWKDRGAANPEDVGFPSPSLTSPRFHRPLRAHPTPGLWGRPKWTACFLLSASLISLWLHSPRVAV